MQELNYKNKTFMVTSGSGFFNEHLKESEIKYEIRQLPVTFVSSGLQKRYVSIYTYESVNKKGTMVDALVIEEGDEEGGAFTAFNYYGKIDDNTALELEEMYYKNPFFYFPPKYYIFDKIKNGDDFTHEAENQTEEGAIKEAEYEWAHLTESEKANREYFDVSLVKLGEHGFVEFDRNPIRSWV